uniref:Retropepsins domain-containing protein n=1 Tax=Biomphalaria glabrata TaxID=6526 RepID=A0A2C9LDT3_BIOGL
MDIYEGLEIEKGKERKMEEIVNKFESFCIGKTNETYERYVFNTREQQEGEDIEKYITNLRRLAKTCSFERLEDSLIRDRVVLGIRHECLKKKLLQDSSLTLERCRDICRAYETANKQLRQIQADPIIEKVSTPSRTNIQKGKCRYCGRIHEYIKEKCPAWGKMCLACKGKHHFAVMCKKKIQQVSDDMSNDERQLQSDTRNDVMRVKNERVMSLENHKTKMMTAVMTVNSHRVRFQMDSGADVNTIQEKYVNKNQIEKATQRLLMWNKTEMRPIGKATLTTRNEKTNETFEVEYIVVPNNLACLLGHEILTRMKLIKVNKDRFIASVVNNQEEDCSPKFTGDLGDLGEVSLKIDSSIKPK